MNEKPIIVIISGKNPLTSSGGYARYARSLGKILKNLNCEVEIYAVGNIRKTTRTHFGKVIVCENFLFAFPIIQNMAMLAFPIFSIQMAWEINKHNRHKNLFIWGIGPWSLTGVLLKIFSNKKNITLADYFTTIKHEFNGRIIGMPIRDYGQFRWLSNKIAEVFIIPFYSKIEHYLLKRINQIITHYHSTEQIIVKEFSISNKFIRLPYSVEKEDKKIKSPDNPQILLLGRQDGRKGINYFLHACKLLEEKKIKYRANIIGTGELENANKNLAKKLGLKSVKFLGFIKNPYSYFTKQTVFVLPSTEEGSSSLALLEAMAFGLPVISSDVDGIPEDLTQGKSGILVKPKDPKSLAQALEKILQNHSLSQKLARYGKKEFEEKHNLSTATEQTRKFISSFRTARQR